MGTILDEIDLGRCASKDLDFFEQRRKAKRHTKSKQKQENNILHQQLQLLRTTTEYTISTIHNEFRTN